MRLRASKIIKNSVNAQFFFFYLSAIVYSQKYLCTVDVEPKKYRFGSTIVGYILVFGNAKNSNIII